MAEPSGSVRFLDHTADVGLEAEASSLAALLEGAARGMTRLILGDARPEEEDERVLEVEGEDPPLLLRNLLRELLYLHEAEGFALARCRVEVAGDPGGEGEGGSLRARCRATGGRDPVPPDRELKGVTLHGLAAERRGGGGWFARVIFDV